MDPFPQPGPQTPSWLLTAARAITVAMTLLAAASLIHGVYIQAELDLPGAGLRLAITTAGMGVLGLGGVGLGLAPFVGMALLVALMLVSMGDPAEESARKTVMLATITAWWLLGLTAAGILIHIESISDNAALATAALLADAAALTIFFAAGRWGRSMTTSPA